MAGSVEWSDQAFLAGMREALEGVRKDGEEQMTSMGERAVEVARQLAPKRTDALENSIHFEEMKREGIRRSVGAIVAGGGGVREATPMEFGTYKDRAEPYMRPAMAQVSGGGFTLSGGRRSVKHA